MTYREIVERLQDIREDLSRLHARHEQNGHLETDDEKRWDDLKVEFDDLLKRKEALERRADIDHVEAQDIKPKIEVRENGVVVTGTRGLRTEPGADEMNSDPIGEVDSLTPTRGIKDPWDTSEIRLGLTPRALEREYRSRASSAIERMAGVTPRRQERMQQILDTYETRGAKLSQQLLATSSPTYLRAFAKLAQSNGRGEVLNEREREAVARAMSLADTAGGYLVPFQLDPSVILTSDGSVNEIRQAAREVVATGDVWHGVSAGEVTWTFDQVAGQDPANESGTGTGGVTEVTDGSPTFAQPTVTVKTARGFVPISLEAYMDESNVASEIGRLLAEGKDTLESQVFATGSGNLQPTGIITALAASATAELLSNTSNAFALSDVYKVDGALPTRYQRRASWLANHSVYNLIRQFDTAGGAALWARIGEGQPNRLLDRPAYEAEAMDGTINSGEDNFLLVYGDFQHYVIADRIGMTVEFVPHLFGGTSRYPTGRRGWFAYYRVGANVVHDGAFRLLNVNDDTT